MRGQRLESDEEIRAVLAGAKAVAVIGLSPNPSRDSHRVASYLQDAGYRIVPVHPAGGTILGEPVLPGIEALSPDTPADLVDVFRRPDALPALLSELPAGDGRTLWLQLGVTHPEAEEAALAAGWNLVVNRCALVEHRRLLGA